MKTDKFRIVSSMSKYYGLEWYHVEYYADNMLFGRWTKLEDIDRQETYEDALKQLKKYIKYIEYKPEIHEFDKEDLL